MAHAAAVTWQSLSGLNTPFNMGRHRRFDAQLARMLAAAQAGAAASTGLGPITECDGTSRRGNYLTKSHNDDVMQAYQQETNRGLVSLTNQQLADCSHGSRMWPS